MATDFCLEVWSKSCTNVKKLWRLLPIKKIWEIMYIEICINIYQALSALNGHFYVGFYTSISPF